ncbi:sugar fermentation stimulation protein A [Methylomusa anaerophila]|uniref:Sugar fermentation stimulation protein homolog n=2 Tax=Methylomusa anaerophila TaxID=1930071 RepID=A0A348ANQ6_9FIRM|nr:sugar fermentation stimulation protein A [Methylomusa anaerophila]
MKYDNIIKGVFIERPNRFLARVTVDGSEQTVHVKNTGRCKEILLPGVEVILEVANNPARKTSLSLIGVYKGDRLINIDSQAPNQVVFESLLAGNVKEIGRIKFAKKEVSFANSRFDIFFETDKQKGFIEVKGVTLEENGTAMFPDAPTLRGTKHLQELIKAAQAGYICCVLFLIQMRPISYFTPNVSTDPNFAAAVRLAARQGVNVLVYDSIVQEDEIKMGDRVPCLLFPPE